ncbi:MAG TPA: hypothetical protein VGN24_01480 [Rhodanobacter sp.]|jgi:hypothetical protein|nr:hypothetical protein [Rhodanobacter sp.]
MQDDRDQVDQLIVDFFAAFDNRGGRMPPQAEMVRLFADKAIVARHQGGTCTLYSPPEFAAPRVALLNGGALVDFHEWEETSSTEFAGAIAARTSRYAKTGLFNGAPYGGKGTKFFQLAKFLTGWRIVALSWIDDA